MTYRKFVERLGSEDGCIELLFRSRWPNGFVCPDCSHTEVYLISTRRLPLYECRHCRKQTSLISGTILERSRTSLSKWLYAMHLLSQPGASVNAVDLQHAISVTYKTAFRMLHRIRLALGTPAAHDASEDQHSAKMARLRQIVQTVNDSLQRGRSFFSNQGKDSKDCPRLTLGFSDSAATEQSGPPLVDSRKTNPFLSAEWEDTPQNLSGRIPTACGLLAPGPSTVSRLYTVVGQWIQETFHGLGNTYLHRYLHEYLFRINALKYRFDAFARLVRVCVTHFPSAPAHSHNRFRFLYAGREIASAV